MNKLIEKYLVPQKPQKRTLRESSEMWFNSWSKPMLIYIRNEEVLFSTSWEFPTGSPMTEDIREKARARGYILLDW